ncbi:hypothetical protein FJ250_12905 [bacterium]|nr:hypothetical protein [bacterium]
MRVDACRAVEGTRCEVVVPKPAREGVSVSAIPVLVLLGLALGAAVPARAADPQQGPPRVLVFPFENASRDAQLTWLGEGAALLLSDRLRDAGADALTRDERLQLFERLQVPPLTSLSRATVLRLGHLVGAQELITGEVMRDGDDVVIRARRILLDTGVMEPDVSERAPAAGLLPAFDRLSRRVHPLAADTPAPSSASRPPLAAFERYVRGLLAATPQTQASLLEEAVAAFPALDAARVALWEVRTAAGDHKAAVAAARAVPEGSPLFADAQFRMGLSYLHLERGADAVVVWKALHERAPAPGSLNNIGVAVMADPALAPKVGRASWFFSQARSMDDRDADYVFNLGYAYWLDGDPSGAVYWLKECVRLAPADSAAHAVLAQALQAAGQPGEAARELSLAQRLSSAYDGVDMRPGAPVPRGLARLKNSRDPRHARRVDAVVEGAPQDQQELAAFYLERGRRLADRELDLAAEAELTRGVYFAPYDAEAHLLLGRIYLRSGRLQHAIDAVKVSLWSEESAAAHLVLAEAYLELRNTPAARAEAERALALDPRSVHAAKLIERLPK